MSNEYQRIHDLQAALDEAEAENAKLKGMRDERFPFDRDTVIARLERKNDDLEDIMARHIKQKLHIAELEADCKFLLGFAPKDVPPNYLDPTFYHTLTYEGDCLLQERVDNIRAALITENSNRYDENDAQIKQQGIKDKADETPKS